MSNGDLYTGREQTLVKHFILRNYLERFAIIVGSHWNTLTYVDCFSGPWKAKSEKFEDSSFAIALDQLRKARDFHKGRTGRTLNLRCFFLEKTPSAYKKLKHFTDPIDDIIIETKNKKLEDAVQDILNFVQEGGQTSFPFIFIDPKGWSGFAMETIARLLRLDPGEVLINFMTEHIRRFVASPQRQTQDSFTRLFGTGEFKKKLLGLSRQDREDALIATYSENVKRTGAFGHVISAIVLNPNKNRTHFHLIYATRDLSGVAVFKDTEKKAMPLMEQVRGEAQERDREQKVGHKQLGLFVNTATSDPSAYFLSLRNLYTSRAKTTVFNLLQIMKRISYDEVWSSAMSFPLIWESDLKDWLRDWKRDGCLEFSGMKETRRVPQLGQNIFLVWKGPRTSSSRG